MIRIERLTRRFGTRVAVSDVSLHIPRGSMLGLLGENGAGKTTLVRMIATLLRPDAGSCVVGGCDTIADPTGVKRQIGVVFQENNLDRDLSVQSNLMFHARLHRLPDARETVRAMLDRLGLRDRANMPISSLSGGMQRRLVIGRA
ncbi:MAG: ABC transporter ATP-binding protein, partial [Phyllobacteriaceae bacterium]|nr:ABC transporter ATP-binding protein [Phyllobacteriaceae bacterium]